MDLDSFPTRRSSDLAKGERESGHVWQDIRRARGLNRRRDGFGVEPAAPGKCYWELRQSSAAYSGEDCAGSHPSRKGGVAARDERGRDGAHGLSGEIKKGSKAVVRS